MARLIFSRSLLARRTLMKQLTHSFTFWGDHGLATWELADVEIGDRLVPQEIFVYICGGIAQPDLEMKIEVRDGIPQCVELMFRARPDGPEVRDKDLAVVRVGDWLEQIVAQCSLVRSGPGTWSKPVDDRSALADITRSRAGRPRISREHLKKVAEVYRRHFDKRPTEAVARAFGVKHRTAARYVQQARAAGYLPDTDPGKKKA
jgi:hypothetical protein